MKTTLFLALAALPVILSSCATPPPPPQAYHGADDSALVIKSIDERTCQILSPIAADKVENDRILTVARALPRHQTAVVILENYDEPQIGDQFRDRGTPLFVGLRGVGYEHIYFLRGKGVSNPEGLVTLVKYD